MRRKLSRLFLSVLFVGLLVGCVKIENTPNLDDLDIEAYDAFDIEAGTYEVAYTIDDLNLYIQHYDLAVEVTVTDQDDDLVDVTGNSFLVEENHVYTVHIVVYDMLNEVILKEKTVTVTAVTSVHMTGLEVIVLPDQLAYLIGDVFQPTGMVVEALFSDGTRVVVTDYHYSLEALSLGDESFLIEYLDFTAIVTIMISDDSELDTLDPPEGLMMMGYDNVLYFMADVEATTHEVWINGLVVVVDVTLIDLTDYLVEALVYDIKVRSMGEGKLTSEYSEIYSLSMIVDAYTFEFPPQDTYIESDYLDINNIVIVATYTDGRFTYLDISQFTVSHNEPLVPTDDVVTVTVTATGETLTYMIDVTPLDEIVWTVVFDGNGGDLVAGDETQLIQHNQPATAPQYTHKTWLFDGWDKSFDSVTGNMTVKALWINPEVGTSGLLFDPVYNEYYQTIHYEVNAYGGFENHVVIPATYSGLPVKSIMSQAFINNKIVTQVTLPASLESIGWNAFVGTSNLTDIHVNGQNPFFASHDGVLYNQSFTHLVYVPEGKTGVLDILDGVISIQESAVRNSTAITEIIVPDSVTTIGHQAFLNTQWYQNQPDGLVFAGRVVYTFKGVMPADTHIVLGEDVLGIADNAFQFMDGLVDIEFQNGLKVIGNYAFQGCSNLVYALIPPSVERIGFGAFSFSENLTTIHIPDEVVHVAADAFNQTKWYADQPAGVIYLGNIALGYKGPMSEGTSIVLREGTTAIAESAFADYVGLWYPLTNIHIPDSVVRIGQNAFNSARGLSMVFIPASVTEIGINAFINTQMTIYVEAAGPQPNWHNDWNPDPREVIYGSGEPPVATDYILYYGIGIDPITLTAPFLSHIPNDLVEGFLVSNWFDNPDLEGIPISFPYQSSDKGSTTLYADYGIETHLVTFLVPDEWVHDDGGPLIQIVLHGQSVLTPPTISRDGYTFLGWQPDLSFVERDLNVEVNYAAITISSNELTNAGVWVRIDAKHFDAAEINLRHEIEPWTDYIEHDRGSSYYVDINTVISARVLIGEIWYDLDDVIINFVDTTIPSAPNLSYYQNMDETGYFLIRISGGLKQDGALSDISHTEYRINKTGDWITMADAIHWISVPYGTTIEVRTFNTAGTSSFRVTETADLETFVYDWPGNTTERHRLRIVEHYDFVDITIVRTRLIGSIEEISPMPMDVLTRRGVFKTFYEYPYNDLYIGCGPKAAEIFLGWFGSSATQLDLVQNFYIRITPIGFVYNPWIFTTPAQLNDGISRYMLHHGFMHFDVHRRSTNTTNPTVRLIEGFLNDGFPVIILVEEGDHYKVISESIVTWSGDGRVLHADFMTHDNSAHEFETWQQLEYFFENDILARILRLTYSSYRDMILSIRVNEPS